MPYSIRSFAKKIAYPAARALYRRMAAGARFSGNYASWEEAVKHSTGYCSPLIIERVTEAALKVKRGEAVFERDSVLFDEIQYSWPVIAGLMWIAAQKDNRLSIVDFGGSLGSSYFQARNFLADLRECRWSIVEQKHFVDTGRKHFEDGRLRFYETLDECTTKERPDAVLLSSVLQYLPKPYAFLEDIVRREFSFIIVDRTPFFLKDRDRLTVQKVPASIYPASYPAWILNLGRFQAAMKESYDLVAGFDALDRANIPAEFKGFIYRRRKHA